MSKLIQLQPEQVTELWEYIKWAAIHAEQVPSKHNAEYTRKLLAKVLTGFTQIWTITEESEIKILFATSVKENDLTGLKELFINFVYGYKPLLDEDIFESFAQLKIAAKNMGCKSVSAITNIKRVSQICETAGATQPYQVYQFNL